MRVYVDEMPKNCNNCPCKGNKYCNLSFTECKAKRPEDCWLELLADHDKQVRADERKKACEAIIEHFKEKSSRRMCCVVLDSDFAEIDFDSLKDEIESCIEELDQIEKGESNE